MLEVRQPRIAIVSDPLVQRGGAERVVEAMAEAFPDAPVHALLYSARTGPAALRDRIRPSWLNRVPGSTRRHRAFLPLYRTAIESIDLRGYDIIVTSHHTVAKGIVRHSEQLHVCYCHTPMRALWERSHEEISALPPALRPGARALFASLREWDLATVSRVDHYLANSRTTQRRITLHWMRESTVVYPPIDVHRFTPGGTVGDYYLVASRPVAYKRADIAIAAAKGLGRRVVVVGGTPPGPRIAGIEYRGHVTDGELISLMRSARALLFPQIEDFGMTPLEVNACGRPVVALGEGGALETVLDGVTGALVGQQTVEAFMAGIERFEQIPFSSSVMRSHAERFARPRFIDTLRSEVDAAWISFVGASPSQRTRTSRR
jgi:glycosyltransferase involved in cell wall biosynthesis